MNWKIFQWRSLKTRVILFTLTMFLIGIWLMVLYASRMLREDMERRLGEQQFSTVSLLAANVDVELDERLRALEAIAASISPATLANAAALQSLLEQRPILQIQFNAGVIAFRSDGIVIADVPRSSGRIGVNYSDRDNFTVALKEGRSSISQPVIGRVLRAPLVTMAAPIRDTEDKVIGALVGAINLGLPNFLDRITESRYGKTGGYFLVAPQSRLIVTASDKGRVMEQLPASGVIPGLDRLLQGYEGSATYVNPLGVEVLASGKGIPAAGWSVGAVLPTAEAFAPIRAMQQRMLVGAVFLTLLAGGLAWWMTWSMLRRQLSPMLAATRALATLSDTDQPPQPLPIGGQDEIGDLIGGFNRLLEILGKREEALRHSERRLRAIIDASPVPLAMNDERGNITYLNQAFAQTIGYTANQIPTLADWWTRAYPDPGYRQGAVDTWQSNLDEAMRSGRPFVPIEVEIKCKDESVRTFVASVAVLDKELSGTHLVVLYDVTERKRQENLIKEHNALLTRQKAELEATLARVRRLEGLLSICMSCKKIRGESNSWLQLEKYLGEHSDAVFSHGLCPECFEGQKRLLG